MTSVTSVTSVMSVLGPVPVDGLGLVLTHEHLVNDLSAAYSPAPDPLIREVLAGPVSADIAWALRDHPYHCADNCRSGAPADVEHDLRQFALRGGSTVLDLTPPGLGRQPDALAELSRRTGVTVVMGSGWYLDGIGDTPGPEVPSESLVHSLLDDFHRDGPRPGVIGEIGVSPRFTAGEEHRLRAAGMAQRQLGVPIFVHTPGWERVGHRIVDILVDEIGVTPGAIVLCHMDPSGADVGYQHGLAARGVMLGFDMIGMPFSFPGEGPCPTPDMTAGAIAGLMRAGFADQLLLSHDLFLTAMLTRHGGNGLSYVPFAFPTHLSARGVARVDVDRMLTSNPARVFRSAATRPR